jgi:hypothetical protein
VLATDLRIGSQRPTSWHEPPEAVDWTLSDIAVEWNREVAGIELDEWQEWLVRWTFARRRDGLWSARDVGVEVGRQNGKNIWLEAVELPSVFEFGDRLVTHSAHRADVSHEHFLSLKGHIEASDELMALMPTHKPNNGFITTNGNESIELDNGSRILFKARAKASGRGPRPQKIVFDEALVLEQSQVGSMAPGTSAQRNPQIIFASSAPLAESEVLHSLRRRMAAREPGDRLFYAAWNNEQGTDPLDRDAWYRVNPSLGYGRMTEDSLLANRNLMSGDEFLREHLGVPGEALGESWLVQNWDLLVDAGSVIDSHRSIALDVTPDRRFSSLAWAGRRADGDLHVEAFDHRPGTGWVVGSCVKLRDKWRLPVRIQQGSPAAALADPLREAGVDVVELTSADHAKGLGQLLDAAAGRHVWHLGAASLTAAVKGAEVRSTGEVDVLARRSSKVDISPLVAVVLAMSGVPKQDAARTFAY